MSGELVDFTFRNPESTLCSMLYALCFLKSTILNLISTILIPLDYGGEDGNTFLKWVEAHTTAVE